MLACPCQCRTMPCMLKFEIPCHAVTLSCAVTFHTNMKSAQPTLSLIPGPTPATSKLYK